MVTQHMICLPPEWTVYATKNFEIYVFEIQIENKKSVETNFLFRFYICDWCRQFLDFNEQFKVYYLFCFFIFIGRDWKIQCQKLVVFTRFFLFTQNFFQSNWKFMVWKWMNCHNSHTYGWMTVDTTSVHHTNAQSHPHQKILYEMHFLCVLCIEIARSLNQKKIANYK